MSYGTETTRIFCPYCGEPIEVIVDLSVPQQAYVEDCSVCCRPIELEVSVEGGEARVSARHEND